jgi:hypothetical protein
MSLFIVGPDRAKQGAWPAKVQGLLFFCCKKLAPEQFENAKNNCIQGVFKLFSAPYLHCDLINHAGCNPANPALSFVNLWLHY